jgi:hypothetical protein
MLAHGLKLGRLPRRFLLLQLLPMQETSSLAMWPEPKVLPSVGIY